MKNENKNKFLEFTQNIEKHNLYNEKDYFSSYHALKKISMHDKNYILVGDLKSSQSMSTVRSVVNSIEKMDKNIHRLDAQALSAIVEKMNLIKKHSKEIANLIKQSTQNV